MTTGFDIQIVDEPQRCRYVAFVDGEAVGFAEYVLEAARITFTHTAVTEEFEGRGVGSQLAAGVLDDALARHLSVEPRCPFIAAYVERHPEYCDLVEQAEP